MKAADWQIHYSGSKSLDVGLV